MKCAVLLGVLLTLGGCLDYETVPPVPPKAAAPELYQVAPTRPFTIAPGDKLLVSSYYHPALKQLVAVQPDGRVSLLLVGTRHVAGKTTEELATELVRAYDRYVEHPEITVNIDEAATLAVYVGGEVVRPVMMPIRGELTLLQSITQAGGFLPTANKEQVLILRQTPDGGYHTMQANADLVLRNQADEVFLRQHDVVFVPKSPIARIDQFVDQYINQIIPRSVSTVFAFSYALPSSQGGGGVTVVGR